MLCKKTDKYNVYSNNIYSILFTINMNNIKQFITNYSHIVIFIILLLLPCLNTILYHSLCKAIYDNKCYQNILLYHYFDMVLNTSLMIILFDIYTTYISNKEIDINTTLRQNYYFNLQNINETEKLLYYLYKPFYNKKYQSKTNLFLEVLVWFIWSIPIVDILYLSFSYILNISFSIYPLFLIITSLIIYSPKIIRLTDNLYILTLQIQEINKELERSGEMNSPSSHQVNLSGVPSKLGTESDINVDAQVCKENIEDKKESEESEEQNKTEEDKKVEDNDSKDVISNKEKTD